MAIKDKNGNVYRLRGPNPVMEDQDKWDSSKMKLINLSWSDEVVEDENNPIEKFEENLVKIDKALGLTPNKEANKSKVLNAKEFIQEIREAQEILDVEVKIEKPIEALVEEPIKEVEKVDPKISRIIKEKGVEYYCAPVIGEKTHVDEFYGTNHKTMKYGDQFIFNAVLIDQSDLELQFWSMNKISTNSIVYRKIREGGERWWRVKNTQEKTGGYLITSVISDLNPDFS